MPRDYAAQSPTTVRRADRAVTDEAWIRATLHTAAYGTLATVHDGQPFLNSNLFVYDEARHAIYLHTAHVGRTKANVEAEDTGAPVCFGVFAMGRLLPADEALEFSVEYEGVTVFGTAQVVEDSEEAEHGLQLLLDKYAPHLRPGEHYRPITADELKRTAVYRVDITEWVGKKKAVSEDFPGAFLYPITEAS
ncbi:MAG: pyridoxamine 5'-phosphate oxidase family protein [Rhodothermaceae bacterium]|nr:pyridoxamine 5'-phosphate oxidase family protein [Rhodothermaceae bacterium]